MSVILVVASLVFGGYLYQPLWFSHEPHHFVSEHKTLEECQVIKNEDPKSVCVGESPSLLYTMKGK